MPTSRSRDAPAISRAPPDRRRRRLCSPSDGPGRAPGAPGHLGGGAIPRQGSSVGIVQLVDDSRRRATVELLIVQRIDREGFHVRKDRLEQLGADHLRVGYLVPGPGEHPERCGHRADADADREPGPGAHAGYRAPAGTRAGRAVSTAAQAFSATSAGESVASRCTMSGPVSARYRAATDDGIPPARFPAGRVLRPPLARRAFFERQIENKREIRCRPPARPGLPRTPCERQAASAAW